MYLPISRGQHDTTKSDSTIVAIVMNELMHANGFLDTKMLSDMLRVKVDISQMDRDMLHINLNIQHIKYRMSHINLQTT